MGGGVNHLIHKVNRPPALSLVSSAKAPENDPGSSQGSGVTYENFSEADSSSKKGAEEKQEPFANESTPNLSVVVPVEQIGMTEVLRDFHENKKEAEPRSGLTVKYSAHTGNAKGLLLNKKAE